MSDGRLAGVGVFSDRCQMAGSRRTFRVNAEGCAEGCMRVGLFQACLI